MGWATYLTTTIEYYKQTYNHKCDVESELSSIRNSISKAKETLTRLAYMTEPQKFCDKDERPDSYIKEELEWALEALEEGYAREYKLELLLREWDNCHNEDGLAIECPYDFKDTSYLEGDYVYTDKNPTQDDILGYTRNKDGEIVDDSNAIVDRNGKFKPIEPIDLDSIVEQSLKEAEDEKQC